MAKTKTTKTTQTQLQGDERKKALEAALAGIEKSYGKGAIMKLGDTQTMNVEAVSTGSLTLDLALGIGGVPRGRIIEIFGPESSGKTTVALHIAAEVQKLGGEAAFIDAEHALDPVYAKALGVDIDSLLVSQPDSGEQALEITDALVRSGAIDVVVVDSVAALVPQQEIDGEMGSSHVGAQARLMSQALRKLSGSIAKTRCVVIFINQLREKVGVLYGNPETTPGGRALKFYSSVRLDVRKSENLKSGNDVYGSKVKVKVVKNKVAPPFKVAEFEIIYGKGISKASEIIEVGVQSGVIKKSGSFFYYGDLKLGQGKDNAKKALEQDNKLMSKVEEDIKAKAKDIDLTEEESYSLDEGEEDELLTEDDVLNFSAINITDDD